MKQSLIISSTGYFQIYLLLQKLCIFSQPLGKLKTFFMQGCALAEPVAPGTQLLLLGDKKILDFSYKSYAGHPRFYTFRALGSLQFS